MTDKEMSMLTMGEEAEVNSNPSLSLPHTEKLHLALSFLTYAQENVQVLHTTPGS